MRVFFSPGSQRDVQWLAGVCELVEVPCRPVNVSGFFLWWHQGRLALHRGDDPHGVSLEPSTFQRRALLAGELARACGVMRGHKPSVLDAMGGLGVDGMTLVELGCEVVMVERATVVWAMMASFMKAYQPAGLTLIQADAWSWLAGAHRRFDVVYLDPMFPGRHKGALPGKAMQYLTELTELTELTDADSRPLTGWIDHAKAYAIARVVLKRRLRDSVVGAPDWQIKGRTVRYDVYRGIGGSATTE